MTAAPPPSDSAPSAWIRRFTPLITQGASVLDVACGRGRHVRWFAARGHPVTGIDRDPEALAAASPDQHIRVDLENTPWPLPGVRFGAVVVTNYLWRPLLPHILESVTSGGVLLYETFAMGQETMGRPRRAEFLLRPGELLGICTAPDWRVVAFEDGFSKSENRFVQRIAAMRAAGASAIPADTPRRYPPDAA